MDVRNQAGGTTTTYIYSGTKVIAEYVGGTLDKEYIYLGAQLLATIDKSVTPEVVTYHHKDHLSVRVNTDSTGTNIAEQGHYPFGESWYKSSSGIKWDFTNYERDPESGLNYATFRFDSSRLGSFMTPDPIAGNLSNPQSMNRYAYVQNNPINFVDPLGLDPALDPRADDTPNDNFWNQISFWGARITELPGFGRYEGFVAEMSFADNRTIDRISHAIDGSSLSSSEVRGIFGAFGFSVSLPFEWTFKPPKRPNYEEIEKYLGRFGLDKFVVAYIKDSGESIIALFSSGVKKHLDNLVARNIFDRGVWGFMHAKDVGSKFTDYRSVRGDRALSLQEVLGSTGLASVDVSKWNNIYEHWWSPFPHIFFEMFD